MDASKCLECKKKLNLADSVSGKCKCGGVFCKKHKDSDAHKCSFDYHASQKEFLKENMVVVQAKKVATV